MTDFNIIDDKEKYQILFDQLDKGIIFLKVIYNSNKKPIDYRIMEANSAIISFLNLNEEDLIGKSGSDIFRISPPPFLNLITETSATSEPVTFETYNTSLKKHLKIFICSPKNDFIFAVIEDITKYKNQIEKLNQKNEEIARFTYAVTHDLKSPLVTVRGFLKCLEDDFRNHNYDDIPQDIAFIKNSADKMWHLLEELLEVAKAGYKKLDFQKVTLDEILSQSLDLVSGMIIKKNVEVILPEKNILLQCDRNRMVETFQNLLDNSIKFMGNQSNPTIKIEAKELDNNYQIILSDNGIGIDKNYQSKIFDIFEKLDPSIEGSGIGLSLVKRIIEVHNGSIKVSSKGLNQGTSFFINLPK